MSSTASSYFHSFWIINTFIATIFWWLFVFLSEFYVSSGIYWEIFFSAITIFGILSFGLFFWKSWKFSIVDSSFSAIKTGLRISLSWMIVWDIFLLWRILIAYFENPRWCGGIMGDGPCSFWERPMHDFETFIILWIMGFLVLLPILFSITGFYLDRRKNKVSFPWMLPTLFVWIILFFIWFNIYI